MYVRRIFRFVCSRLNRYVLLMSVGSLLAASATAEGLVAADGVPDELAGILARSATHQVNELSNRRRLTTFFTNEQSPFYGVQINYVNVRRGNLTFLNRDLVRLDRMPIVFGRVYDSQLAGPSDFGPGWKLTVAETIRRTGATLEYWDASGSVYELTVNGDSISSEHTYLTGIGEGLFRGNEIELRVSELTKRFQRIRDTYYLSEVEDSLGQTLRMEYQGTAISRIVSSNGRAIEIERDSSGRIVMARDDSGRTVGYEYDPEGNLSRFHDVAGGSWELSYDMRSLLTVVTDPRDATALHAEYDESGRAGEVSVLFDSMVFNYDPLSTRVDNPLGTSATFWHHASGLTRAAQDFEGANTEIEFNEELQPVLLQFNGGTVARLSYDGVGRLGALQAQINGAPEETLFDYDQAGRLLEVTRDGDVIAAYRYGLNGQVITAMDPHGDREYRYTAEGLLRRLRVGTRVLDIDTSERGLLLGFGHDEDLVQIRYDDRDQVLELFYRTEEEDVAEVRSRFNYAASGLRSGGEYVVNSVDMGTIAYDYDSVGNLTDIELESPEGEKATQTYTLGSNNQVIEISSANAPSILFEYDAAGRPTRSLMDHYETRWAYDRVGRLSSMSINGTSFLQSGYGPMDVDAATEADDHTPLTAIAAPVASSIFGSLEAVAYARVRGTAYGPIRFSQTMARFTIAQTLIPAPDAVLLASLKRRFVPIHPHVAGAPAVSPIPLGFDKPSNGLFLPAEYSSLNCYYCYAMDAGGSFSLSINGTNFGTASGIVGQPNDIFTEAEDYYCIWIMCGSWCEQFSEFIPRQSFTFGDGTTANDVQVQSVQKTYNVAGTYLVKTNIVCWGCDPYNPIPLIWMGQASRSIEVCEPSEASGFGFHLTNFSPRPSYIQSRYFFANPETRKFRFSIYPAIDDDLVPPDKTSLMQQSAEGWDANTGMCGDSYFSEINFDWRPTGSANVSFEYDPDLAPCGGLTPAASSGSRDVIRIRCLPGVEGPADGLTTAHEIGHALGFVHRQVSGDLMSSPPVGTRSVRAFHIRKLLEQYFP